VTSFHNQLAKANILAKKTASQRQTGATDRRIDQLVYKLYDLTEEEITVVEAATA